MSQEHKCAILIEIAWVCHELRGHAYGEIDFREMRARMNIQIFGKSKCFDTKKAERFFKERGISFQADDLVRFGMSRRELDSVKAAVGGLEALIDPKAPDAALVRYLAYESDKEEKLLENPKLLSTPIVRNGRKATVGYCPKVWESWIRDEKK